MAKVISQGINEFDWNLPFTRDPHEWEIPIVGNLMEDLPLVFVDSEDGILMCGSPRPMVVFL